MNSFWDIIAYGIMMVAGLIAYFDTRAMWKIIKVLEEENTKREEEIIDLKDHIHALENPSNYDHLSNY